MKTTLTHFAVLLGTAAVAAAALRVGDAAFTKRVETALLAEPRPMAAPVTQLPYAREVKVQEVQGAWVRVASGAQSGWVFSGNLASAKPSETRGLDGLPLAAAETSATAAARPLAQAAVDYAGRRGLGHAAEDLHWLEEQAHRVTPEEVQAFLETERKGEFQ